MDDTLRVGVITSSHGVRGEVKVYPTTDDITRFKLLESVMADTPKGLKTLNIEKVHFVKGMAVIKFKEFSSIEDMMPYKGCDLLIDREQALPLEDGEYYIADLVGLGVLTDDGRELGTLTEVMQTGANDVYIVKKSDGSELLIPAIRDCVLDVDLDEGRMKVHMLPGLEEI